MDSRGYSAWKAVQSTSAFFFIYIFQYCHSDFSWTLSWQYLHMLSRMKRHFNIPIYALIADRIINSIATISELNKK